MGIGLVGYMAISARPGQLYMTILFDLEKGTLALRIDTLNYLT
jgi:hypothetical protein